MLLEAKIGQVVKRTKYLTFQYHGSPGITPTYAIFNNPHKTFLGYVKWHGPWRRYVLDPQGAIFDSTCLEEISKFVKEAQEVYRNFRFRPLHTQNKKIQWAISTYLTTETYDALRSHVPDASDRSQKRRQSDEPVS